MKRILTIIFLSSYIAGFSQQIDTVYLTENNFIVELHESDYYSIITQTNNHIRFCDFFKDSSLKSKRSYLNKKGKPLSIKKLYKYNTYANLIKDGLFTFYSPDGVNYEITEYSQEDIVKGPFYFDTFGDTIVIDLEEEGVEKPIFDKNNTKDFRIYVADNLNYPTIAAENKMQGKVFVQFVINKEGKVELARILRGIDSSLNNEAIRVIKSSPDWIPARKANKSVSCVMTMPIVFVLQ